MNGEPATGPLLTLAEKAEGLGFNSVWVGDSLLAKPRHEHLHYWPRLPPELLT